MLAFFCKKGSYNTAFLVSEIINQAAVAVHNLEIRKEGLKKVLQSKLNTGVKTIAIKLE